MSGTTRALRRAYGLPPRHPVTIVHGFYNKRQLHSGARGDFFSATAGAQYAGADDVALTFIQAPGFAELRRRAMPSLTGHLIELNPPSDLTKLGYPQGCVVERLRSAWADSELSLADRQVLQGSALFCLFPYPELARELAPLEMTVPQCFDAATANAKPIFLAAAATFGVRTCAFRLLPSLSAVQSCALALARETHPWWLKGPGSGGDFVVRVAPPLAVNLPLAWQTLAERLVGGLAAARFTSLELSRLVDPDSLFPREGLVLERDIGATVTDPINAASVLLCDRGPRATCLGLYSQDLRRDPLQGAFKLAYDPRVQAWLRHCQLPYEALVRQICVELDKVHRFLRSIDFLGIYGVDFFLSLGDGAATVIMTEINARVTTDSGGCRVFEDATGYPFQMPFPALFPGEVNSVDELREYCRQDGRSLLLGEAADDPAGGIMPQNFGCIWHRSADGGYTLLRGSRDVRLMLVANRRNSIARMVEHLLSRGVVFKRD